MWLGAALAVVLTGAPAVRASEPDKLLPADADTTIFFNVRQLLDSDIMKKYALAEMKKALEGAEPQKVLRELGLDPFKDVERVIIAGSGKDQSDIKGLVIVRGKFDPDKLYKAAEAYSKKEGDKFSMLKDGNNVMFKIQPDNGNPVYATVVDEGAVVLGTEKKLITTAVAAAAGNKKPTVNKDLAVLIGRMDDKATMWVAAVTKGKLDNLPIPGGPGGPGADFQKHLPNMESITFTLRVTADVAIDLGIGMKDEGSADDFHKVIDDGISQLKGLLALAGGGDPKAKAVSDVVRGIKTGVKGKSVTISAKMTGAAIGQLVNMGD